MAIVWAGPDAVAAGLRTLRPALQYLAGELPVDEGQVMPLLASHNTVRLRFDIETADYLHLHKADASFPHNQARIWLQGQLRLCGGILCCA